MMLTVVIAVFSIAIFIYAVQILRYAFVKIPSLDEVPAEGKDLPFITVVVPFRNEKNNLSALLEDLKQQAYAADLYEVIFVDDHSGDGSFDLLKELTQGLEHFSVMALDSARGKKQAVDAGVKSASGSWILQIDADCRLGSELIPEYAAAISSEGDFCFVAGPVSYVETHRLWDKIETIEFLSLAGSGMYSFQTGRPVMCNGANMAYAKDFYMQVSDKLLAVDSPSGDDVFLLMEAKHRAKFLFSKEAIVLTYPSGSLAAFLGQRIRWGSKAKVYKDRDIIFLAFMVYLASFVLTALFVLMFFVPQLYICFVVLWFVKLGADLLLMRRTLRFYDRKGLMWLFPLTALFYYFYIAIIGPLSLLSAFRWKERSFGVDGLDQ